MRSDSVRAHDRIGYEAAMIGELWQTILSLPRPVFAQMSPDADLPPRRGERRVLRLYLIKPTRYDDEGELMQFRWGVIPGNTLAVVSGLARAWAGSRDDVELQPVVWDELVDPALDPATIAAIRRRAEADRVELLIGLTGVQTGEYPRAREIASRFRRLGVAVAIGGFHVSSDAASREELQSIGVTTVSGEAETTIATLLDDFLAARLREAYQPETGVRVRTGLGTIEVPSLDSAPMPSIERRYLQRFFNPRFATIDTSRGCPFVCSFCAVKNVMGRTVRARPPQRVVDWIRHAHDDHGMRTFLLVDDDLFRSPTWEPVLTGIAELRRAGRSISLFLQTDVESAGPRAGGTGGRAARFVELAAAAGCYQVFLGFESLEPANLALLRKHQNRAGVEPGGAAVLDTASEQQCERYRRVVAAWHSAGVGVHCGYMLGLPGDSRGCGARAARRLAEIGLDIVSFFAATPLPGTEDFAAAQADGSLLVDDWGAYDTTHFVRRHAALSRLELEREYADAYRTFYSLRRLGWSALTLHHVVGLGWSARAGMLAQQLYYGYASRRGWHPMLGGIGRRPAVEKREPPARESDRAGILPLTSDLQPASESLIEA